MRDWINKHGTPGEWIVPGSPFEINFDVDKVGRGIALVAEGAVSIRRLDGTDVTIPTGALAAGVIHAIAFRRINSSGTTLTEAQLMGFD